MCGISGIFAFTNKAIANLQLISNVNDQLKQRGPDEGQIYINGNVALGHRRLSIIDISHAGDQPMHSIDGHFTIVFNGEIFNFKQLKEQYLSAEEQKSLRSHSDTEVFLVLYSKLKEKAFRLLDGFFAAAIYDHRLQQLTLVRDRYGKKPLVFFQDADRLVFASELKAIFSAGIPREIDWNVLSVYFQLNYIPQPYSIIKGVQKVIPGHYVIVSSNGLKDICYYKLELNESLYTNSSYKEAQNKLVSLMDEAVQKRLISDVPLGAFLSGGIDSSVVVALASRYTEKLNTFSIGYRDHPFYDETSYALLVAEKYKTEHTVFSLSNDDFLEHITSVLDYIDEPFADSSAIPVFILSHYTRQHVTVALSGDGGDEVFAGYNKHGAEFRVWAGGWQNSLVKVGAPLWAALPQSRGNKFTNLFRQLDRYAKGIKMGPGERYWQWASFNSTRESISLFTNKLREEINETQVEQLRRQFISGISGNDFNEVLLTDMNLVLLSDMLVKVDLMSMANSLEIRSPFLDSSVVEFAFGLPASYKINGQLKKRVVQDAFREMLPAELYNRPKKGFEIPLLSWFRNELWPMIDQDLLEDDFIDGQKLFDVTAIRNLKKQLHSLNPGDATAKIWALIVFQHWWKRYMAP